MDIAFLSSEGRPFALKQEELAFSKGLYDKYNDRIADRPSTSKEEIAPIPIEEISGAILAKIIEWCKYHHKCKGQPARVRLDEILDVSESTLFELVVAANNLRMHDLRDAARKKISKIITAGAPKTLDLKYWIGCLLSIIALLTGNAISFFLADETVMGFVNAGAAALLSLIMILMCIAMSSLYSIYLLVIHL